MERVLNSDSGSHRRNNENYLISPSEINQFNEQGYLILNEVLSEAELESIDPWFEHFIMGGEQERMGRDFCDMSQPYGTPFEEFQLVNAMLPGLYRPEFANNIFHRIALNVAKQLYSAGKVDLDYEQFLAKKPSKHGAEFAMHQDLGYWPKTKNTWTATFSLALTDADQKNGCLHLIPGTNREDQLRKHVPKSYKKDTVGGHHSDNQVNRDDSHTLVIETTSDDNVVYLPVTRGSITIHDERIVHGSGGNFSEQWRKTYIMAFRDIETIKEERALGFTHSHNDRLDWKSVVG